MDRYLRAWVLFVRWLVEVAPSERAFLEGFFLDIYTPRAYNDGTVDRFVEEVLAFPHKQKTEDVQRFLDALVDHDTTDRLPWIAAPTLVLAGVRTDRDEPSGLSSLGSSKEGGTLRSCLSMERQRKNTATPRPTTMPRAVQPG
jgi:pimeloyl-ACP methyl ester carboxylesterase